MPPAPRQERREIMGTTTRPAIYIRKNTCNHASPGLIARSIVLQVPTFYSISLGTAAFHHAVMRKQKLCPAYS